MIYRCQQFGNHISDRYVTDKNIDNISTSVELFSVCANTVVVQ